MAADPDDTTRPLIVPVTPPLSGEDLSDLENLEKLCFDRPWSKTLLARELEQPDSLALLCRAAGGRITAWLTARVIAPEAELLRIAVAPAWRRRQLAAGLVARLEAELSGQGVSDLFLEVAENNRPALELYRSRGFTPCGRRPGYYDRGRTTARLLKKTLFTLQP